MEKLSRVTEGPIMCEINGANIERRINYINEYPSIDYMHKNCICLADLTDTVY